MKRLLLRWIGWHAAAIFFVMRITCRVRVHNDPRPWLWSRNIPYTIALLHAHQLAGSICVERGSGVMVSRSDDGEIIVPTLRVAGMVPIRGSSGTGRKGGATAFQAMLEHVKSGNTGILTVDGPRGPRGRVQKGIGMLAEKSGAAVMTIMAIPTRRWVINRAWDRLQIPMPFSTIDVYFDTPLEFQPGESLEQFAERVEQSLQKLEALHDPDQAASAEPTPTPQQQRRAA